MSHEAPQSSDLELPSDLPPEMAASLRLQLRVARALEGMLKQLDDIEGRVAILEGLVRPAAAAEARRIEAWAVFTRALATGVGTTCKFVGDVFGSTAARIAVPIGLVLVVLSCAGVQMTVLDVNRLFDTIVRRVDTPECPPVAAPSPSFPAPSASESDAPLP